MALVCENAVGEASSEWTIELLAKKHHYCKGTCPEIIDAGHNVAEKSSYRAGKTGSDVNTTEYNQTAGSGFSMFVGIRFPMSTTTIYE
jgi:hypothetical protein